MTSFFELIINHHLRVDCFDQSKRVYEEMIYPLVYQFATSDKPFSWVYQSTEIFYRVGSDVGILSSRCLCGVFLESFITLDWMIFTTLAKQTNRLGSIHGVPTTFLESVFFSIFFSLNMPVWSRKHFWWKKIGSFLSKISRSRSLFRYMSNIVKIMQKSREKTKIFPETML